MNHPFLLATALSDLYAAHIEAAVVNDLPDGFCPALGTLAELAMSEPRTRERGQSLLGALDALTILYLAASHRADADVTLHTDRVGDAVYAMMDDAEDRRASTIAWARFVAAETARARTEFSGLCEHSLRADVVRETRSAMAHVNTRMAVGTPEAHAVARGAWEALRVVTHRWNAARSAYRAMNPAWLQTSRANLHEHELAKLDTLVAEVNDGPEQVSRALRFWNEVRGASDTAR